MSGDDVKLPEFKKCCLCLPLRGGLLGWAYFKIVANAIGTLLLAYFILTSLLLILYTGGNKSNVPIVLLYAGMILFLFLLILTDFIAAIVFVVAGHKKDAKIIRGYFVYNIGVLIVTILLIVGAVGLAVARWHSSQTTMYLINFAAYFLILLVQVYYTLLVRSAAIKLESSGEFRFVNNSGEAQCMMTNKEKDAAVETV